MRAVEGRNDCVPSTETFESGLVCPDNIGPVTIDYDCASDRSIENILEKETKFLMAKKGSTCTVRANNKILTFKGRGGVASYDTSSVPAQAIWSGWWLVWMFRDPLDKGAGNIPDGPSASVHNGVMKGTFNLENGNIILSSESGTTTDICAMLKK